MATDRTAPIRVLVVDDHPVVRRGLSALVATLPGFAAAGEAIDGESAVKEVQLTQPDVVVMDLAMPGIGGLEAIRRITAAAPAVGVLVLTMHEDDDTVLTALRAGARGYLLKGAEQDAIESALRAVASGQTVMAPGVAARLLQGVAEPAGAAFPELTGREHEVLERLARGWSNAAVAASLGLSSKTISNHLSSLFAKLGVATRSEAIVLAHRRGLGAEGPVSAAAGRLAGHRLVLALLAGALLLVAVAAALLPPVNVAPTRVLVAGFVLSVASVAAGLLLPGASRLRADALLWLSTGVTGLVALALGGGWGPAALGERLGLLAALTLLPAAVVGFPGTWSVLHRIVVLPLLGAIGVLVLVVGGQRDLVEGLELAVLLIVLGAVWWRFERGSERRPGPDRDALRWLALALVLMLLVIIPTSFLLPLLPGYVVTTAALLGLPVAVVLGSRAPNEVEIRTVAARTGGLLLALLVAFSLFAGVVSGLEALAAPVTSVGLLGLVAVGVAALFAPVRRLVDSAVERLLFGDLLDPVGAASRFAAELSAADDPVAALRELRLLLNLPYAAVGDGRGLVSSGRPSVDGEFTLPLTAGGHRVGELRLGLRPGETGPSVRDRPVLRIVVPALAQALRARSLADDVAASRARVVTAVEEDRRRLRRDLHDGLGPTLTGVAYATDAARNVLRSDPGLAEELLTGARADTGAAIAEVRHLVDDLRPAVLDQVGLVAALRQQALALRGHAGRLIPVQLEAPDLPPLGAATEVAVFRIVAEALTNVARHTEATSARVQLALADQLLELEVHDFGGVPGVPWVPGVGLMSMQERVDQLGGTFAAGPEDQGGVVRVTLPLPRP